MMKSNTRIALLGTINRDTIHTPDGVTTESYGGLLYSILALAEIASPEASIYPICNVGADMEGVVREKLEPYPQVKFDGITFVPGKNPHCFIEYDEDGQKQETLRNDVPQISFEQIQPFLECDAICFNFITGMELALETAEQVRKAAKGLLLMDVHSLTLGMDENRRRFWRVPPQWERWVGCVDVVQMNEQEGALLADESLDGEDATYRFAEKMLTLGPSTLMLTRNERGSQTFYRNSEEALQVESYAPVPAGEPQDETGCGDTFLMGFTWAFLQSNNQDVACQFANRVAGINVCLRGIEGISQIGQFLKPEERELGLADD
ncbi:MAG: carbohydrate kinase family protein [Candidatus Latescibacteria bacterium]|nr:carbohydrate kinase family protein [Candidatus Latescibacterota bacterium]MBT4137966.1 carbohydrate kinase family protein [Candidatus Latescibacterota bacterium]MBT5832973.1 carbohydrate kinase family protein [Candidatus Latescibacterota bacterium]